MPTTVPTAMAAYLDAVADSCDVLAKLVLEGALPRARSDTDTLWRQDREAIQAAIESVEPHEWLDVIVVQYVTEAAHELSALAALMRAATLAGAAPSLIRAVVERLGIVGWLLDLDGADALGRAWRTMIHVLMCAAEYRQTVERIRAPKDDTTAVQGLHRALRDRVEAWFTPDKDPDDPIDATKWSRNGEALLSYTDLAVVAMAGAATPGVLKGIYGAQCAMTHPNVVAQGEYVTRDESGQPQFVLTRDDIDKLIRIAFFVFFHGLTVWGRYYLDDESFAALQEQLAEINGRFESASALDSPPSEGAV